MGLIYTAIRVGIVYFLFRFGGFLWTQYTSPYCRGFGTMDCRILSSFQLTAMALCVFTVCAGLLAIFWRSTRK